MSRLRQNNRVKTTVSVQTRVLVGAIAGFTVAAMFLFVALQQSDDDIARAMKTFTKTYPDLSFKKIVACSDGNFIASDGTSFSKVDEDGNVLWNATVTPPQPVLIQSLVETTDHGVIAVAQTTGQTNLSRIYIVKMMQDGTFGWSRTLEKTQSEFAYGACASDDNGLFLCGSGCATYNYVLKLNSNGDQEWIRDFNITGSTAVAQRIARTENGLMLAGRFQQGTSHYIYLATLGGAGQWLGGKMFAVTDQPSIKALVKSNDGGFLLAGQFSTPAISPFVMRTDAGGNPTWFKALSSEHVQSVNDIVATADHSILCIGNVFVNTAENVNMMISKLDPNGNMLWRTSMGSNELNGAGYDDLFSIAPMTENRFMVAGTSNGGILAVTDEAANGFCHYAAVNISSVSLPIQTQILSLPQVNTEMFTSSVHTLASSYATVTAPSVCYGNFTGETSDTTNTNIPTTTTPEPEDENENAFAQPAEVIVNVYPNPTKGNCDVDIQNLSGDATLSVYDLSGRTMWQEPVKPSQTKLVIPMSRFAAGTYVVSFKSDGAVLYQNQIVLQK